MKYNDELTIRLNTAARRQGHTVLSRYAYPVKVVGDEDSKKLAADRALRLAMQARENRSITAGHLSVFERLDEIVVVDVIIDPEPIPPAAEGDHPKVATGAKADSSKPQTSQPPEAGTATVNSKKSC